MSSITCCRDQGRAHGLYDEQLQRLQQEKILALSRRVILAESLLIEGADLRAPCLENDGKR